MRRGFTLVELVVVVLILGILAAVAAPRLLGVSLGASENGLKQTLSIVRDAIQLYAAQNAGQMPGSDGTEATFVSDLAPYLRGEFPENPFKELKSVSVKTSGTPLAYEGGPIGWQYDNQTGQFIANANTTSSDGITKYWEY